MIGSRRAVPWTALLLVLLFLPLHAASIETPERITPDEAMLPSPLRCPVDGDIVETREYGVMWQGRRFYMESATAPGSVDAAALRRHSAIAGAISLPREKRPFSGNG